jgi:hypothetical protein
MRLLLLVILLGVADVAMAATYQVGPTRPRTTLTALFNNVDLQPGDIVEVDGDVTYTGGIVMPAADGGALGNPVMIRGIRANNQRPRLVGGANTIEFQADHVVFEGFDVSGTGNTTTGTFRCVYHHSHGLTIRDAYIHDCPRHGILGADQDSGSLTVEYTEVFNSGSNGGNHALYIATDEVAHPGSVFRLQYSYIHDSRFGDTGEGGNLIKSRAERNEIYYNWLEGAYYHELELIGPDPNGAAAGWTEDLAREDSDVVGNVIVHTSVDFGAIVRFGGDDTGQSKGRYRVVNNSFVRFGTTDTPTVFRLFDGIESLDVHNNVFWRDGANALRIIREVEAIWTFGSQIAGSNNWVETGSSFVPASWSGTLTGAAPGFVDATGFDFRPAAGSALLHMGASPPVSAPAYQVAGALFPPVRHAPLRTFQPVGTAPERPINGVIDIGAFEQPDASVLFVNGFE